MIEISRQFSFDAAHHLAANVAPDHPYARVHGHSFTAVVALRGIEDIKTGWLMDFEELDKVLRTLHGELDHRFLNDIRGLEVPTLETLTRWIWNRLKPQLPMLHSVTIKRGSLGESCKFEG